MFEIKEKIPRIPSETPPDTRIAKEFLDPEKIEDDERINKNDKIKQGNFVSRKSGFLKIGRTNKETTKIEPSTEDSDKVYGDTGQELEEKLYGEETEPLLKEEEDYEDYEDVDNLELRLDRIEGMVFRIENKKLKLVADKILSDSKKMIEQITDRDEKEERVFVKTQKEKGKPMEAAQAYTTRPANPIKPFSAYFYDIKVKEINKIPLEEIEFVYNNIYSEFAPRYYLTEGIQFFKEKFGLVETKKDRIQDKKIETKKSRGELKEELADKHNFEIKELPKTKLYVKVSLRDYLKTQDEVEKRFNLMINQKKQIDKIEDPKKRKRAHEKIKRAHALYEALKKEWEEAKAILATYHSQEADQKYPENIKPNKNSQLDISHLIRKHNFGVLNKEHRNFLLNEIDKLVRKEELALSEERKKEELINSIKRIRKARKLSKVKPGKGDVGADVEKKEKVEV